MMNIQSLPRTPLALAIAAALAGNAAYAQSGDDTVTLAPVTVEASADASAAGLPPAFAGGQVARGARIGLLGNQSTLDTPFSTTAYTSQLIEDQQASGVAEVLRNDPTVRISRGFGNFQELYVIRGFPLFSDDMAYNGLYGVLPRQYVATEFLERVEVLRGANTFVNGAAPGGTSGSGVGGAVNLVPKRAPNEDLTRLTYGLQTGGQDYLAADIARRFGENKELGLRVNAARRVGGTGIDSERKDFEMFSLGADYRGNGFRLSADIGMQDQNLIQGRPSLLQPFGVTLTSIPRAPGASRNYSQPWIFSGDQTVFGTVRGEFDLSDVTTTWFALGARRGKERNSLPFHYLQSNGTINSSRFDNNRDEVVVTGEAGIRTKVTTGAVNHRLSASVSGHWRTEKNENEFGAGFVDNLYDSQPVPRPTGAPNPELHSPQTQQKTRTFSIALADTMSFADDRFLLTLGARLQKMIDVPYNDYALFASSYDKTKLTPAVGAVYKLTQQISLYANYAEALTRGSTAPATANNANERLSPFVSKQTEAGIKYEDKGFGAGLAVFSIDLPSAFLGADNVFRASGEQQNSGVELTLYGEPLRGLRLLGGATWINAELKRTAGGVTDGNRAIGVPAAQYTVGVEWDVPLLSGLSLDARTIYTGSQYFNAANAASIPSWTRFDLGARYITRIADKDVTFRARIDNVSDRAYWASAGGYPGSSYLVQGAPRTAMLSATVHF